MAYSGKAAGNRSYIRKYNARTLVSVSTLPKSPYRENVISTGSIRYLTSLNCAVFPSAGC